MNAVYDATMAASMAATLAANANVASDKTQMRLYLDTLKAMVPQRPKSRKVSRHQLIEHVITSISNFQDTLHSDSDSDSEDDSRPGSPMNDVTFSDSFSHQPQFSGYGVQPHHYSNNEGLYSGATNNALQPQYGDIYQHSYNSSNTAYNSYYSDYNSDGISFSGYNSESNYMQ